MSLMTRSRTAVERYGVGGAINRATKRATSHVSISESHVWYALDLSLEVTRRALDPTLTLRAGTAADLPRLGAVQTNSIAEMSSRLDAGNRLWLVLDAEQPLFATWIFSGSAPVLAAAGGRLALAEDTVCMEDSESAPAARGRGVAPAAFSEIAALMADESRRWLITKVATANTPARRAVEKSGYEPVATMNFKRRGTTSQTQIEPIAGARASVVAERLVASLSS
jgi:GNAT superfamily N-acetyltransferase